MAARARNLQELVETTPNLQQLLYNNPTGGRFWPNVPPEFSNWRDEQRGWRETVVLFEQSYHMTNLYVRGPDAFRLLNYLSINSFQGFQPGQAKQMVCVSPDGYYVGDAILFYLDEHEFVIVGVGAIHNWVEYHAQALGAQVALERDESSRADPRRPRTCYRFQLQGPNARPLMEKLTGGRVPDIPFFHFTYIDIAGHRVGYLHHGMVGVEGAELWGPFDELQAVKGAILEAGAEFGLRQVGSRTYATNALESGWIPNPLPAVYTGEQLRPYREWLPATAFEAVSSLGGSFVSDRIEDYYLTPWDLGYGRLVKFDHDFIGRAALERMAHLPHRKRVTFVWDERDTVRILSSVIEKPYGHNYKYFDLPLAQYATWMYDAVLNDAGEVVGFAMWTGFDVNERAVLALGTVRAEYAQPGTRLRLIWGEPNGGSRKPSVERHVQTEVQVTVGPVPYSEPSRRYREMVLHRRG